MFAKQLTISVLLFVLAGATAFAQTRAPVDSRIDALVRKLGSSAYLQREQARKELEAIGTPALDALRRASKTSDAETSRRLADLIQNFEEQLLTKQVLAPKEIHLKLKDATVQQAIAELANISGYPLQFLGDATPFADKKITLDTGKTTFWQAVDQICNEAGLMERVDLTPNVNSPLQYSKPGIRRVQTIPPRPIPATPNGPIILTNRGTTKSLVHFSGSLKTELRVSREAGAKDITLNLIVSAEPRLMNNGIVGSAALDKLIDQESRKLALATDAPKPAARPMDEIDVMADGSGMPTPMQRFAQIRIKNDGDTAKNIKEFAGKLTYQLDMQNEVLAKMDKAMDASGKSVATKNGGTMKIVSVKRQEDKISVEVALENTQPNPFGNNIIINGGGGVIIRGNINMRGGIVIGPNGVRMNGGDGTNKDLPDLLDAKGQRFKVLNVDADGINLGNGSITRTATIHFQAHPGQAEPREFILYGTRTHTIGVPFRFVDVPLP